MEPRGRTSVGQFSTLLEFMERHGDIARPQPGVQGRIRADLLWQELATTLNSVKGGIHKTPEKWRKVWADWKSKTKKKAITIRNGTGGIPRTPLSLTTFEERLLEVMGAVVEGRRNIEEQAIDNSSQAI